MNYFFDNMVPPGVPPYLKSLSREHEVIHKKDRFPSNTPDDVWITELAKSGHWNIVTIDLRIVSTPHLAAALETAGHTAFFLQRGWSNLVLQDLSWKYPKAWWSIEKASRKRIHLGQWFTIGVKNHNPKLITR